MLRKVSLRLLLSLVVVSLLLSQILNASAQSTIYLPNITNSSDVEQPTEENPQISDEAQPPTEESQQISEEAQPPAEESPQISEEAQPSVPGEEIPTEGWVEEPQEGVVVSPESRAQDGDSPENQAATAPVSPAAVTIFDAPTNWTVGQRLGVGTDTPDYDVDIERHVSGRVRLQMQNLSTGSASDLQFFMHSGPSNGFLVQKFGSGYTGPGWSGIPLASWTRLRTDTEAKGLILTTGGPRGLVFGTHDTTRMVVDYKGNVGIGTITPSSRLTVVGADNNGETAAVRIQSGVQTLLLDGNEIDALDEPSPDLFLNNNSAGHVILATGGGNVGIGTSTPDERLHVVENNYQLRLQNPDAGGGFWNIGQSANFWAAGGGKLVFVPNSDTSSNASVVFTNNGRVGIGTVNPVSKFHVVDGNIRITNGAFIDDGIVLNVPDYVFEPDYPLMPLDELRTYLAEEKHLPNVPDMEEIHASGLNLSEFQMRLLEKTEELTLYTLAQDEQLQTQQQQIDTLLQQNAELETRLAALEEQD